MHDIHLVNKLLKAVVEVAEKNNLKEVNLIEIELGEIVEHGERISPENLEFNFKLLSKGSIAEKAKLDIKSVEGDSWKLKSIEGE